MACQNALHSGNTSDKHRLYLLETKIDKKGKGKEKKNKKKYFVESMEGDGTLLIGSKEHFWYKYEVEEKVENEKTNTSADVHMICMNELREIL